jgi:Fic/DOC family
MPKDDEPLPPILLPGTTTAERRRLARLKEAGRIHQVGPRLYASVPKARLPDAIRGSWTTIVAGLFPRALISHRTALDFRPSPQGEIFLTTSTNREVRYPGLRLRFLRGPGPLPDDPKFLAMHTSSRPRAFLENLATTRPSTRTKVLPGEELERRLEQILHVEGRDALHQLRDRARQVAQELGWRAEFERLDGMIGEFLGTQTGHVQSAIGRARAAGKPFDPACLERLQLLFGELQSRSLPEIREPDGTEDHRRNKAFFEAYFSNYIEGTTFEIEEAERIVFDNVIPARRPRDAHDITGTFQLVSDPGEMRRTPQDPQQLVQLLQSRHQTMLVQRPEVEPGDFKDRPNRAGTTQFVAPEYVRGTLDKGLELYLDLRPGLSRAIFIMFLVAEVHPFNDGNGRIARIMMNADLVSADHSTIIIPTVYRDDYLQALRALTRRHRPALFVDMLVTAQRFSHLAFSPYPAALKELQRRNWFREPEEARIVL